MIDRHCKGRLDLFLSTKIADMFNKYSISNNDNVPVLHAFNWKSNTHKKYTVIIVQADVGRWLMLAVG